MRSSWLLLLLLVAMPALGQSVDSSTASFRSNRVYLSVGVGTASTSARTSPNTIIGGVISYQQGPSLYSLRPLWLLKHGTELALLYGRGTRADSPLATISIGPALFIPLHDPRRDAPGFARDPMLLGASLAGYLGVASDGLGGGLYGFITFYPADQATLGLMLTGSLVGSVEF